jgi:hypothetical protein
MLKIAGPASALASVAYAMQAACSQTAQAWTAAAVIAGDGKLPIRFARLLSKVRKREIGDSN